MQQYYDFNNLTVNGKEGCKKFRAIYTCEPYPPGSYIAHAQATFRAGEQQLSSLYQEKHV
jgi:hypothetical protein